MSSDPPLKPDSIVNKVAGNLSSKVQGAFKENWAGTVETGHPGGESNDQRYVTNPVTGAANSGKGSGSSTEGADMANVNNIGSQLGTGNTK